MHIKNLKQVEATIDFDKVYDDRKRYLDAGIGDGFAGWRADIERLPDRSLRPFRSRPRGASRPVRLLGCNLRTAQ